MNLNSIKDKFENKQIDKWNYIDAMYAQHEILFDYCDFIKNTNISKIEIVDGDVIMTFRDSGVKLICTRNDKRLAPFETLNFGGYEAEELQMQKDLIDPGFTILDIGGNYGWYAIHMAKCFPTSTIYSFEPIPNTFDYLVKNLSLNEIKNVSAQLLGLSDSEGSFVFYYDPSLSVNASLKNLTDKESVEGVNCKVSTLDIWSANKAKIDFIKCDVEGAELLVFKGAIETIKRDKPIVFSEMLRKWTSKFDYHPNEIIHLFKSLGYSPYVISDRSIKPFTLVDENTIETNFIFLHDQEHKGKIEKFSLS
jgi:FkbM family methyltransferase